MELLSEDSLQQDCRELQLEGKAGRRRKSGSRGMIDWKAAGIAHVFQEGSRKFLRASGSELRIPVLTLERMLHEQLGMLPY